MNFNLFGGARAESQGSSIRLATKQKQLLALLILKANRFIDPDVLVDHLWGEYLPSNPTNSLQDLVRRLRNALGDTDRSLVATEGNRYGLQADPDRIDIFRFRKLALAGLALVESEPALAKLFLDRARQLASQGDLPDVAPDSPFCPEIDDLYELQDCVDHTLETRTNPSGRRQQLDPLELVDWSHQQDPVILAIRTGELPELKLATLVDELCDCHGKVLKLSDGLVLAAFGRACAAVEAADRTRQAVFKPLPEALLGGAIDYVDRARGQTGLSQVLRMTEQAGPGEIAISGAVREALQRAGLSNKLGLEPRSALGGSTSVSFDGPLIGRSKELAQLRQLIPSNRLITLRGPGGIGKSRLAWEVGRQVQSFFPEGVWFVDLTEADRNEGPVPVIARKLGLLPESDRDQLETLADRLSAQRTLLILDNCEDLLAETRAVTDRLVVKCPGVAVLATSRQALGAPHELVQDLEGLDLATTKQLLGALVNEFGPPSAIDFDGATTIKLCRMLEGMPLAVECSASLIRSLGLEAATDALTALPDGAVLPVLDAARGGRGRHQSIELAVRTSYRQLGGDLAGFFERLACLRGAFNTEDARVADTLATPDELQAKLELLSGASLVKQIDHDRWRMLEPIRQFAATALMRHGNHAEQAGRHAAHFVDIAEQAGRRLLGPQGAVWMRRIDDCYQNMVAALSWTLEDRDSNSALRMVGALWWYWVAQGMFLEGLEYADRALSLQGNEAPLERAAAALAASHLAWWSGNNRRTETAVLEALSLADRSPNDEADEVRAWAKMGLAAAHMWGDGDYYEMTAHLEYSAELFKRRNDLTGLAICLATHGGLAWHHGDDGLHLEKSQEALAVAKRAKHLTLVAQNQRAVGLAMALTGATKQGRRTLHAGIRSSMAIGNQGGLPLGLCLLGILESEEGDVRRARHAFAESLSINRNLGQIWPSLLAMAFASWHELEAGDEHSAAQLLGACRNLSRRTGILIAPQLEQRLREGFVRTRTCPDELRSEMDKGAELTLAAATELASRALGTHPIHRNYAERP